MGKKIKLYAGEQFSTVAASPLGQAIKYLQEKITLLLAQDSQIATQPSLEHAYSKKQLKRIAYYLEKINYVLSFFEEGAELSGLNLLSLGKTVLSLMKEIKNSTDFDTPAFAFYRVIKEDFSSALASSLKKTSIQVITAENSEKLKAVLKAEFRLETEQRFSAVLKIPGYDLNKYFVELDQQIDLFDFTQLNTADHKEVSRRFNAYFRTHLFDKHSKLTEAIKLSLRISGVKQFDNENVEVFRQLLSDELRKNRDADLAIAANIPGFEVDEFYREMDEIIKVSNFTQLNGEFEIDPYDINSLLSSQIRTNNFYYFDERTRFLIANFQITDPLVYNVALETLELLQEAPEDFKQLVSFLNPSALKLDLQTGILAPIAPDQWKWLVEHTPTEENQFSYKLTLGTGERAPVVALNLPFEYKSRIDLVKEQFTLGLANYYRNYAGTAHVKNELAKSELISQFIGIEKNLDRQCFNDAERAAFLLRQQNRNFLLSLEAKIEHLTKLRQTFQNSHVQITALKSRKSGYEGKTVAELVAPNPVLLEKMKKDGEAGLDLGYTKQNLPDLLIVKTAENNFRSINVRKELAVEEAKYKALLEKDAVFIEKIADCDEQLRLAVSQLQEQELAKHQNTNQQFIQQLGRVIKSAKRLSEAEEVQLPVDIDERLAFITQELELEEAKQDEFSGYLKQTKILQDNISKAAECSELVTGYNPSFADVVSNCYQPARVEVKESLEQLQKIGQNVYAKKERLLLEFNKAKAAKILSETMKSSDPSVIIALRDEKVEQNAELQLALDAHRSELVKKLRLLDECRQLLHRNTNPDPLDMLEKLNSESINRLMREFHGVRPVFAMFNGQADTIFSDDSLTSIEGCEKAAEWLKTFFEQLQELIKKAENLRTDQEMSQFLRALQITEELISQHKEGIPFKALDSELEAIFKPKKRARGFDLLLDSLGVAEHSKEIWEKYRKAKPTDELVVLATISLLELIDNQINKCKDEWRLKLSLQTFKDESKKLQNFSRLLQQLTISVSDFELAKNQRKQFAVEEKELEAESNSLNEKIKQEQSDIDTLTTSIAVLDKIAKLFVRNQELNSQIGVLDNLILESATIDLLNTNQPQFIANINIVKINLKELEDLLLILETDVNLLSDKAIYQENVDKIKSLLLDSKLKICTIVNHIFNTKLSDLTHSLDDAELFLAEIKKDYDQNTDSSIANKIDAVNLMLPKVKVLNESLLKMVGKKKYLEADALELVSELSVAVPVIAERTLGVENDSILLQNEVFAKAASLIDTFMHELADKRTKISVLHANEIKESQAANQSVLEELSIYLDSFPEANLKSLQNTLGELKLEQSTQLLTKLTDLLELYKTLVPSVDLRIAVNKALEVRIIQREDLAKKFSEELTRYLQQRSEKYAAVDLLFNKDAIERSSFIDNLKVALNSYATNGDSQVVFDCIAEKDGPFLGFNLQPIINRTLLEIKTLDKSIPNNYEAAEIPLIEEERDRHAEALEILDVLNTDSPEFVAAIRDLYNKIGLINNFAAFLEERDLNDDGSTANKLAVSLSKQVDSLLINNQELLSEQGNSVAKKTLLENFQVEFICQLHSQNDVLSKHYSWAPRAANIVSAVLAVITIGLSAGITAIATKIITGRASIFFKPDGIECVDAVDKVVHEIIAPAA